MTEQSDGLQWGYAQHEKSIIDVTDEDRWQEEEQWAIDNALTYARLEQIPGLPSLAPGPDFMHFFERMLDANLHVPLNVCTTSESETVRETEQMTLADQGLSDTNTDRNGGESP